MSERTTAADDLFADLPPGERSRFERVRDELWPKLRRVASRVPFAEDVVAAYYCVLDRETPTKVRAVLIGALAYFILPADAIPDILPVVGFTDDAGVIAAALAMVARHITDRHRDAAKAALERLRA
jgi:uncharacterized membrane protein YkvA (DUF1232 family)